MLHIGCHLSSAKGFLAMGRQALALDADTFQFFTRNPRGSRAKALDPADAAALMALLAENRFAPIIAHAPYILNLCGGEEENRAYLRTTLLHSRNLIISAFGLLEPSGWSGTVENILYLGLPMVEELVFTGRWTAVKKRNRRKNP